MNTIAGKLARVVRKVDNDTRRINHYPADNVVSFTGYTCWIAVSGLRTTECQYFTLSSIVIQKKGEQKSEPF